MCVAVFYKLWYSLKIGVNSLPQKCKTNVINKFYSRVAMLLINKAL